MKRTLLMVMMALCLAGCGETMSSQDSTEKDGEEAALGIDGKADTFYNPTVHDDLSFTEANPASFEADALFHAWDFTLQDAAWIELRTETSGNLDTVAYLYHRQPGTTHWGSYIAKNDDHEGNLWSLISGDVDAGEYRFIVKPYKTQIRGEFSVWAKCEGDGCPGSQDGDGEFLTEAERRYVVESLDNICGDTFCAGDFSYHIQDANCDGQGSCQIDYIAQPYSDPTWATREDLLRYSPEELTVEYESYYGLVMGSLNDIESTATDGNWAYFSCVLDGGYTTPESLIGDPSSPQFNWDVYSHFLECISISDNLLSTIWWDSSDE